MKILQGFKQHHFALSAYVGSRQGAWGRQALQAVEFATLCHADGLVRRMRDRLWANQPLDDLAAIIGSAPGDHGAATAGWLG